MSTEEHKSDESPKAMPATPDNRARREPRTTSGSAAKLSLGFLTVVESSQHGLCGGYLLLNSLGRPLEFHCTAPIKPNRAQEILYGPTLQPFLYGEQIGQTLLAKSRLQPAIVYTDCEPALAVREHVELPVVLVLPPEAAAPPDAAAQGSYHRLDPAHAGPRLVSFSLGQNRVAVSQAFEVDQRNVEQLAARLGSVFDLREPFQRIREAIEEAQRASAVRS